VACKSKIFSSGLGLLQIRWQPIQTTPPGNHPTEPTTAASYLELQTVQLSATGGTRKA